MNDLLTAVLTVLSLAAAVAGISGCAADESPARSAPAPAPAPQAEQHPPEAIRAWMDRLTVEHAYDPATGFIVAKETVPLPSEVDRAPTLDEAVRLAAAGRRLVIAFATADRCAPCQQYKKDALNDPRVIERLADPRLLATHVEVDRQGELAEQYLGSRAIPMTYALRDGRPVAELRGQRSPEELLAWLDNVTGG